MIQDILVHAVDSSTWVQITIRGLWVTTVALSVLIQMLQLQQEEGGVVEE